MDGLSITGGNAHSLGPSVTSILGVKGPLRFRLHGSSQKAHVVLRRVTVSDDSSDDGEVNRIVRFSLFAQKRIEVKPGKEILLTVASPDGTFKDQPIVLEGDFLSPEELSDEEDDTQVAEEEEERYLPPAGGAIPPKMRRTWTKTVEEVSPVIPLPITTHSSIGVQAEPVYVSTSIQVLPTSARASVQTHGMYVSTSVQAEPAPLPPRIPVEVQTLASCSYINSEIQTDDVWDYSHNSTGKKEQIGERSLSPMELDSPVCTPQSSPSSPPYSPDFSPTTFPKFIEELDFFKTSASPDASSSGAQDMQLSPIDNTETSSPYIVRHLSHPTQSPPLLSNLELDLHNLTSDVTEDASNTEPTLLKSPHLDEIPAKAKTARMGKPGIHNPFVSAGFMTEFVGPADTKALGVENYCHTGGADTEDVQHVSLYKSPPPKPTEFTTFNVGQEASPIMRTMSVSSVSNIVPISVAGQQGTSSLPRMSLGQPTAASPTTMSSMPTLPNRALPSKSSSIPQNAVASSSKVLIDRTTPLPSHLPPLIIPSGPRSLTSLSNRAREKSPVLAPTGYGSRPQLQTVSKNSPPPPDPKSLAYIPSGPSSNPLNIRPSATMPSRGSIVQRAPPTAPKVLTQPGAKKRVVVGSGWPPVRAPNGGFPPSISSSSAAASQSLPPPAPPSGPFHATRTTDLSNILSYSSPSPPATPATSPAVGKWRRVANDVPPGPATLSPHAPVNGLGRIEGQKQKERLGNSKAQGPNRARASGGGTAQKAQQGVALKDRLGPASTPVTPQPHLAERLSKLSNGPERDLRSRISELPAPQAHSASPVITKLESPETMPSFREPVPRSTVPAVPQPVPAVPFPLNHPLPAKPVLSMSGGPSRGIKRERPATPDLSFEPVRRRRRTFPWPTVDSNFSVGLKGDGDLAIKSIVFNSDGSHFALSCSDRTIRIWNNREKAEIARLSHNAAVVAVAWMDGDSGVVSLGEDGLVSKWTRSGQNHWQWAKVLDAGNERRSEEDHACLAYMRDMIAVSFPRTGVKVWAWLKGTWVPQRSILRQNVSAIKFVEDGDALIGGCRDGVLWYCELPNGTLRANAILKAKINSLDLNPTGTHVLVGQVGGCAQLIALRQSDHKVEQIYSCKETEARPNGGFGALFATQGQAILFGSVEGCVLVWDRKKGSIVYGLEHEEDDLIQAVASFDGLSSREGCLITGTKGGYLAWWSQPVAAPQSDDPHKRARLAT